MENQDTWDDVLAANSERISAIAIETAIGEAQDWFNARSMTPSPYSFGHLTERIVRQIESNLIEAGWKNVVSENLAREIAVHALREVGYPEPGKE